MLDLAPLYLYLTSPPQMNADPLITVIIPTSCESSRANFLNRSIKSTEIQQGVQLEILLVCNGNKQDEDLMNALKSTYSLKIVRLEEGNVSKARYEGLRNSNGEYFCFLDDDDEFLEGSLSRRLEIFQSNPKYDVVVTNGLLHTSDGDEQLVSETIASKINSNPSLTFLEQNWFALSCPQVLGPDGMLDSHRGARHGTEERTACGEARRTGASAVEEGGAGGADRAAGGSQRANAVPLARRVHCGWQGAARRQGERGAGCEGVGQAAAGDRDPGAGDR